MAKKNTKHGLYEAKKPEKQKRSIASVKSDKAEKKTKIKLLPIIISCVAVMLIAAAIFVYCVYRVNFDPNATILANVTVAGVDVGGMTQAQAVAAVQAATNNTYTKIPMIVNVMDDQVELSPAWCEGLNVPAAVRAACRYGQSGLESRRQREQKIALTTGYAVDLSDYLDLDEDAIREALAVLGAKYSTTLSQSTYEVTGSAPNQKLIVHLGVPEYGLDLDELYNEVLAAYSENQFITEGTCKLIEPTPVDLQAILDKHYVAPVDAKFEEKTFNVIDGKDGYGFDIEAAKLKLQQAEYGSTVEIPFESIPHEVTAETLSAMLFRDTLATYTAKSASVSGRDTNLRLSCEAVDGIILYPGDVFVYNATLGERTAERGWKTAAAYLGGKTIEQLGGGICQISSSLYYCAMMADLEILTRENHGFVSAYMPLGMDATVSWGEIDFRFKNTMDYPIRIEASASGGWTTVQLIGTDTRDYYVDMEYEVISVHSYETVYETMPADNPDGYKDGDYITTPYTGYTVKTYRCKYNKETDELISRDFETTSVYSKRDAVICKIEDDTTTGPTDAPTTGPEEDPTTPGIGNGGVTEEGSLPTEPPVQ